MKIVQITDCHLLEDPQQTFCGICPDQHLKQVIAAAQQQQPDLVLLTGDCSQDASPQSYQRIADYFKVFNCPVYAIPGNHDDADIFQQYMLSDNIQHTTSLTLNDWQIVFLDSVIPGETPGHLKEKQFEILEQALENSSKTIVVMHHHPLPVSEFMDRYIIDNHQAFVDFIKDEEKIKAVIFGHIHGEYHQKINHIDFYGCPASSVQFSQTAKSKDDGVASIQPGFRLIKLNHNNISTFTL